MSVVQAYKEIVTDLKEAVFGVSIDGFHIERERRDCPDLVYTLDSPKWNARAEYIPIADLPVKITYSLSNLYNSYVEGEETEGDEIDTFLTYYEIVELEEITHCMGEVHVDADHSRRWMKFLADNVVSHTSDSDYVEVRFE